MKHIQKLMACAMITLIIVVRPDVVNSEMLMVLIGFLVGQAV